MKGLRNFIIRGKHQKPIVSDVFFKETEQPKKLIIFCHGYKGFKDWGAWNLMAESFSNAGFFFIKFNFSHNGGTADQPIDFPDLEAFGNNNYTKELDDLESVIDWTSSSSGFEKEININDISLIGHSRGGGIVLLKASEDPRVKKIITLAGVCDLEKRTASRKGLDQWKSDGVKYILNGRTKQKMPHFYQFYEDFISNKERFDIKKAVQRLKAKHLIIHGNNDTSVLINEAESLKKWSPKSIYKIIEGANHVFNVSHPWNNKNLSKELYNVTKTAIAFLKE